MVWAFDVSGARRPNRTSAHGDAPRAGRCGGAGDLDEGSGTASAT
jgi:hypothetical protein